MTLGKFKTSFQSKLNNLVYISTALTLYSMIFMRFAWRVTPRNLLLLGCHVTNFTAQSIQGSRFIEYNYLGGKNKVKEAIEPAKQEVVPAAVLPK